MKTPPESKRHTRPYLVLGVIAALVLFGAFGSWPYGYYRFLRWGVSIAAVVMALGAHSAKMIWGVWVLGLVALLFNPLVPFHLTRDVWGPIDASVAILLLALGVLIRGKERLQ